MAWCQCLCLASSTREQKVFRGRNVRARRTSWAGVWRKNFHLTKTFPIYSVNAIKIHYKTMLDFYLDYHICNGVWQAVCSRIAEGSKDAGAPCILEFEPMNLCKMKYVTSVSSLLCVSWFIVEIACIKQKLVAMHVSTWVIIGPDDFHSCIMTYPLVWLGLKCMCTFNPLHVHIQLSSNAWSAHLKFFWGWVWASPTLAWLHCACVCVSGYVWTDHLP